MNFNFCNTMKVFQYKLIILFALMPLSCDLYKEIDYDKHYYQPQIVVHGSISWEHGVHVVVKKTIPPMQRDSNDIVEGARVILCANKHEVYELEKVNEREYALSSVQLSDTNKGYYLQVEAPGFETVISETQYKVDQLEIDSLYVRYSKNGWPINVRYAFMNKPGASYYFMPLVLQYKNGEKEPLMLNPMTVERVENLSQERFLGDYPIYSKFDSLEFSLYSVSKSFYEFGRSYSDYEGTYGDHFNENIYPVKSNIEGGVGVFFSYETSVFIIYANTDESQRTSGPGNFPAIAGQAIRQLNNPL